jgi:hypothetical protein
VTLNLPPRAAWQSLVARLTAGPRLGRMSPRGHSPPSTSENGGVDQKMQFDRDQVFLTATDTAFGENRGDQSMKRRRRTWTAKDVHTLKKLANKRMRAATIARTLKRTEGATRQKAFSLGLSLETRAAML